MKKFGEEMGMNDNGEFLLKMGVSSSSLGGCAENRERNEKIEDLPRN